MRSLTLAILFAGILHTRLNAQSTPTLDFTFRGDLQVMTANDTSWVDAKVVHVGQCLRYANAAELQQNPDLFRALSFDRVTKARIRLQQSAPAEWHAVPEMTLATLRGCTPERPPT